MKVFLAGGTGALGRRVVDVLIAAGHQVTATARSTAAAAQLADRGAAPVDLDIFDPRGLRQAIDGDAWIDEDAPLDVNDAVPLREATRARGGV